MGLFQLLFLIAGALGLAPSTTAFCHENLHITGGHTVTLKEVPFMASIFEVDGDGNYDKVGAGSVVHERFIMTAASCIDKHSTKRRTVRVLTDSALIRVEQEFCHDQYDAVALTNDICLLKLEKAVSYSSVIKVSLPGKDLVMEKGQLVNATGWGATRDNGDLQQKLHQVTIPVLSQNCCNEVYDMFSPADQICAGARLRDFCKGDIGGPLTEWRIDGNGVQVGVISGEGECGKNPGIYTRVTSYLDWINSTINNNL